VRRAGGLLVLLLAAWFVGGIVTAGPAAAHATLVSTDPADGARLDRAPDCITLRFSEPVSLGAGYARLLQSDGTVYESTASVDDGTLTLVPRAELPDDTGYLVTYRVVSADSHPVAGAFSFTVGNAELVAADAASGEGRTDPLVAIALPASRSASRCSRRPAGPRAGVRSASAGWPPPARRPWRSLPS
jgi:copper transport protein